MNSNLCSLLVKDQGHTRTHLHGESGRPRLRRKTWYQRVLDEPPSRPLSHARHNRELRSLGCGQTAIIFRPIDLALPVGPGGQKLIVVQILGVGF